MTAAAEVTGAHLPAAAATALAAVASAELRAGAAHAIGEALGGATAIILEPTSLGSDYRQTLVIGLPPSDTARVSPSGVLARWLRVNAEPLVLSREAWLMADLSPDEREWLRGTGADLCIPFVADGELVACAVVCGVESASGRRLDTVVSAIGGWAAEVAPRWLALRVSEWQAAGQRAIQRSHQLGTAGELAASIAHEVRNPLAAIRSSIQFVLDEALPSGDRLEILRDVLRDLDRIDRTATGLLQLGPPRAPDPGHVRLDRLLANAIDFMRPYARSRGVTIDGETSEPLPGRFDERALWQTMINLLLNACQACAAGGRVMIRSGLAG